ncbi:MAG: DUF3102 domain-containing protein [Oceanospirillaceae bacterium]|nr:DUF3102 domain-containing protein [Oceanospirillaceae bacterium]
MVTEAKFYMAQSAEAMLEAGKRLVVLKENEPHGEFVDVVKNQLGMATRTAQQIMQATLKYSSPKLESKAQALAHLGKTKLFELMAEDDDDLVQLAEGGTVAGMDLDEIDRMTSRELRKALRESRANFEARAKVLEGKDKKITELAEQLEGKLVKLPEKDEIEAKLRSELTTIATEAKGHINGNLRAALRELDKHDAAQGTNNAVFAAGVVAQLERLLTELRGEYDLPRTLDGDDTPDWMRDDADAVIAEAIGEHPDVDEEQIDWVDGAIVDIPPSADRTSNDEPGDD